VQGKIGGEAGVERFALVVVKRDVVKAAEVAGRIVGIGASKAADDGAALLGNLIRVSDVELAEVRQLRRTHGHLPRANERAIHSDGEVHVGFAEVGVVKEVIDAILDRIHVEKPAFPGNLNAELMLFIALRWGSA
jgi:hypothetical protein